MHAPTTIAERVESIDLMKADKPFQAVGPCSARVDQRAADAIRKLRHQRYCSIDIFPGGDRYRVTSLTNLLADGAWNSAEPVRRYIQLGDTFGWMVTAENAGELARVAGELFDLAGAELAVRRR